MPPHPHVRWRELARQRVVSGIKPAAGDRVRFTVEVSPSARREPCFELFGPGALRRVFSCAP